MKKSTKVSLALLPAISLILLGVLWLTTVKPWLLEIVHQKLPEINKIQDQVHIDVEKINFSLIKLQAYATNVTVTLLKDGKNTVRIPEVRIQLDPFNLLIGQINFSYVRLEQAQIKLNESILHLTPKADSKELNLKPIFIWLPKIPLDKIIISDAHLTFDVESEKATLKSRIDLLTAVNQKDNLDIILADSEHELVTENVSQITGASIRLSGSAELQENKLELLKLTTKVEKSFVTIAGRINNLKMVRIKPEFNIKTNGVLIFENLKPFYYFFNTSNKRLPQILGELNFAGQISGAGYTQNSGSFVLNTEKMQLDFIKFGNATLKMNLKNNFVAFDQIDLDHPAGRARVTEFEFTQQKPFKFKGRIQINPFNLHKLFISLGLKNIPADLDASATAFCTGQFFPLETRCESKVSTENIWVKSSADNEKYIVQIKKAVTDGIIHFDTNGVDYEAQIKVGKSLINSNGAVAFENGFDLKFNSDGLDLSDIDNLAHLNFKGLVAGELATTGTSENGVIKAKINAKDFEIDRFKLGYINGDLAYKEGLLSLTSIVGEMEQTLYNGFIRLNFSDSLVEGEVKLPRLYGKSIISILKERFNLPFTLSGQGQGQISFSGPFDFWKLKYLVQAELNRGSITDETFVKLDARLNSDGEKIQFEKLNLNKTTGQAIIGGHINTTHSEPRFFLDIHTQNLRAEEVDYFATYLPKSTGLLSLNGQVTDTLDNIQIQGQASLRDFTIEGQSLLSSQGEIVINRNIFSFNGQVFGRQAQASLQVPFNSSHEFIVKAQLRDLNPLIFLPLIKIPPPTADTSALLTAEIDLRSQQMSFDALKGSVRLHQFFLQRGNQSLKLQKPSEIIFTNGLKSLQPIVMKGPEQNLEITQRSNVLNFNGKLLLRPLQFLVPFIENLTGQLEFDFGVNLNSQRLSLAGDGSVKNGLVQMKGFPYPIKEINADLDFSQSKLIVSRVQAQLNQSPIVGYGSVNFISTQNIDVNIQTENSRIDIEFPPQMQTSGFVKVKLTGAWLPYTLKIDYLIEQGLITKEFTEGADEMKKTLAPSRYLPPQQLSQQAPTLLLDITTKFDKGIIIKNSIIEGTAAGELHITGSPEIPIIAGRVDLQPNSKLFFKDKPFDIQTGFVIFNPDQAKSSEINPEIFINASARVSDYDINLLISGQAKNLAIKPSSSPPLSENDIFSLLALGFTSSAQDQNLTSNTQQKQTGLEVIAALSNQSKFNKKIEEKLGLNVQIAPSVDSTKNIAVPKVIVSKKLSKKISASYARPLTGNQQSNEVKVQWQFHPDYSLNLNYQNQTDTNDTSIIQTNQNDEGNYGVDLEYKEEFK